MIHRLDRRLALALALALTAACGSREPPLSQYDAVGLIDRGMEAYRDGDWSDAIRFLDRFVLEHPTHPRVQEARYYLADAHFQKEEYVAAAGRFTRLAEDHPDGEWADDARFRVCEAYRELSPEATLDQTYTRAAVDHCQSLIVYFPDSEFVAEARDIIAAMQNRLARKAMLNGEFYMRRRAFDSALIYFQSVLRDWPDTSVAPQALARMIDAYRQIGYEREAEEARDRLLREYPDSPAARALAGPGTSSAPAETATGAG